MCDFSDSNQDNKRRRLLVTNKDEVVLSSPGPSTPPRGTTTHLLYYGHCRREQKIVANVSLEDFPGTLISDILTAVARGKIVGMNVLPLASCQRPRMSTLRPHVHLGLGAAGRIYP